LAWWVVFILYSKVIPAKVEKALLNLAMLCGFGVGRFSVGPFPPTEKKVLIPGGSSSRARPRDVHGSLQDDLSCRRSFRQGPGVFIMGSPETAVDRDTYPTGRTSVATLRCANCDPPQVPRISFRKSLGLVPVFFSNIRLIAVLLDKPTVCAIRFTGRLLCPRCAAAHISFPRLDHALRRYDTDHSKASLFAGRKLLSLRVRHRVAARRHSEAKQTLAHELGHLLGLKHSPGRTPGGTANIDMMSPRGCLCCRFTSTRCAV
jgi:hypothetical protein